MASTWQHFLITTELSHMTRYLDTVSAFLAQERKQFEAEIDRQAQELLEEEREDFYDFHGDEYWQVTDVMPRQLYSSFIVSWYSFTEHQLVGLCKRLKLKITVMVDDKEAFGTGIHRARRFLREAAHYEISNQKWEELTRIGNLRNKIVHGGLNFRYTGDKPEDQDTVKITKNGETYYVFLDKKLYTYLNSQKLFIFDSFPQIQPSYQYCKYLISFGKELFDEIFKDLHIIS